MSKSWTEGATSRLHMHMVADDVGMSAFNASSKFNTDWAFLQELHRLGHQAADGWLKAHRDRVGHDSSFDIHDMPFCSNSARHPGHS
jgi:NTE family protein